MLSVAKVLRDREGYYLETVASRRQRSDVLIESDGRWLGKAAASLGLVGTVDGPSLHALLAGVDPVTGELLSSHHDSVRVVAFDCTYSTPKSVSVLHALGSKDVSDQVRAGHEEAATAALGYLERTAARVRRTLVRGEAQSALPAGGLVAAAFVHRASRAPDPHLHSHVLVANLAPGPDGRWSALDARGLFLEMRTTRDLYETQLRSELTRRLGVSWRELQGAWADLAGIDPKVRRAFSRRSVEIAAALERSGRSGPRAARITSARTRPQKDLATPYETMASDWRERSYRLGVSDGRLAAVVGRVPSVAADSPQRWADQALGEQGVAARNGTCRRGDLVRSRCASLPYGAPVDEVERDVDRLLAEGHVTPVGSVNPTTGPRLRNGGGRSIPAGFAEQLYTTPAVAAVHGRLANLVRAQPGSFALLAYQPGDRLAALDTLGQLAFRYSGPIAAVAPGRAAAASFEYVTGIETSAIVGGQPPSRTSARVLVVAEAQRLGPWELSSVLEPASTGRGEVILLAPSRALETQLCTAAVLAPDLAHFAPDAGSRARLTYPAKGSFGSEKHSFGGRDVVLVDGGPMARESLFSNWERGRAEGLPPLLAASDAAVVRALRDAVREAGGSPDDVVEVRRLAGRLAGSGAGRPAVVLGALPPGVRERAARSLAHVAIVPGHLSEAERVGRAAEVARPQYLVSELGTVPSQPSARSAWRSGATAIEVFRRRWSVDDPERAFGERSSWRARGMSAVVDLAEARREIGHAVREIELVTPKTGRHMQAGLGRSR